MAKVYRYLVNEPDDVRQLSEEDARTYFPNARRLDGAAEEDDAVEEKAQKRSANKARQPAEDKGA